MTDFRETIQALVHTAQPYERDGAVAGITLGALRDALEGRLPIPEDNKHVVRLTTLKNPWKGTKA